MSPFGQGLNLEDPLLLMILFWPGKIYDMFGSKNTEQKTIKHPWCQIHLFPIQSDKRPDRRELTTTCLRLGVGWDRKRTVKYKPAFVVIAYGVLATLHLHLSPKIEKLFCAKWFKRKLAEHGKSEASGG